MKLQHIGMRRALVLATKISAVCLCAAATLARAQAQHGVDVAVTFTAVQGAHVASTGNFRLYGGSLEVHADFFHGLGAVANLTGVHKNSSNPLLAPLDMVITVFGPRYTFTPTFMKHRISIYGQGLVGEANGFHSLFATGSGPAIPPNGTTGSANSLAVQAGGGIDVRIADRLSIRAFEADYLRTQLPNGGDDVQNNFRVAAGVVYHFGK